METDCSPALRIGKPFVDHEEKDRDKNKQSTPRGGGIEFTPERG